MEGYEVICRIPEIGIPCMYDAKGEAINPERYAEMIASSEYPDEDIRIFRVPGMFPYYAVCRRR